jgi:ParB family chromosome partitioning protein
MNDENKAQIRFIPIKQIQILNPRQRGKHKFAQIVANIDRLGLKKPITVGPAESRDGEPSYYLGCGQGRLEAYIALGEETIPAIIIDATREQLLLMSMAENIARRKPSTIELVREIGKLKEQGYSYADIARKIDLETSYVRGILHLLAKGEEKLLQAVEKGQIPLNIAMTIASSDDKSIQRALTEAYENHDLRGKALLRARRLVENRRSRGKKLRSGKRAVPADPLTVDDLIKTYQRETVRQKLVVQKAKMTETRLLFVVSALRQLAKDEHFVTLLRAEGLDTMPQYLAEQIRQQGDAA